MAEEVKEPPRPQRIGVVGGGVAGSAAAMALLLSARRRQKPVKVTLFTAGREDLDEGPVLLTPECRSRLATLGVRAPAGWAEHALAGVELISGAHRTRIPYPAAGTWLVDGYPTGPSGRSLLRDLLLSAAARAGATILRRQVDGIQHQAPLAGMPAGKGAGDFVVRAGGWRERFDHTLLATGAQGFTGPQLFPGHQLPPMWQGAQARLVEPGLGVVGRRWLKVIFRPQRGVDALLLLPCEESTFALGIGREVSGPDLCQSLMVAARDGHLSEGFEIASLAPRPLPAGVGRGLVGPGRIAVGQAALGSPLQLSLSPLLAVSTRAASALMEVGGDPAALRRAYVDLSLDPLARDAVRATRALTWLSRAGRRAPRAVQKALEARQPPTPWTGGLLGLGAPGTRPLLSHARSAAWMTWLEDLVPSMDSLPPATAPLFERDLYYLVDDDPAVRESLTDLLESQGAQVVAFSDESALFAAAARRPPTAVILDVVLQWVDGLRLCAELKRHPSTARTRVVMMSGLGQRHLRSRALAAGAEAYLDKPVVPHELLEILIRGDADPRPPTSLGPGGPGAVSPPPSTGTPAGEAAYGPH